MSFFTTSDNKQIEKSGNMEMGGGDIEPIPGKTQVLAAPDEAKWDDYEGDEYISLRWNILQPKEYANRKIFHKLKVCDTDGKKSDKAKRMLAAIDTNAGGKLLSSGERPTDESLTRCLVNKPMVLMLQVWEIDKERDGTPIPAADRKRGNWISAVSPRKTGSVKEEPVKAPEPVIEDDDIPF
jgi:hypothetical protein